MKNFFALTNVTTGEVQGCVTPQGPTGSIYHAKPVLIQAAWLAADRGVRQQPPGEAVHTNSTSSQHPHPKTPGPPKGEDAAETRNFREWQAAMEALLAYWGRAPNRDPATGLHVWHDQLQTGS